MMSKLLPWDEIKTPKFDYNVRKIAGLEGVPLYWGKDAAGHCLIILELSGDHTEQFRKRYVSVHGMKIDLRLLDVTKKQGLIVALENHVDRDLFLALCNTLVSALREVNDSDAALSVMMTHIKRWKTFMAGRKLRLLSAEEVRGLYSELLFLRLLYTNHLGEKAAVDAWCGAERLHQDFIFSDTAVEIKSLSGKERSSVQISSEDQLEGVCDKLYLMVYRLSVMPESDRASSLNDLVDQIDKELADSDAIEEFSRKLAVYGYVETRDYDEPKFISPGHKTFNVTESFPRLVRSVLPDGILRVRYEIELKKLEPYECSTSLIWS